MSDRLSVIPVLPVIKTDLMTGCQELPSSPLPSRVGARLPKKADQHLRVVAINFF